MSINLDALDQFSDLDQASAYGKPLQLDIAHIHEDPDQPRKSFDAQAHAELTDSVREAGVKSPVSVRRHPERVGDYILNFGARRLRAAREAGLARIPAFIDEAHTDYDQVTENLQRDALTPMELAGFIARKLGEGASRAEVARRLGVGLPVITRHMALIDAPAVIEEVYRSGRCRSPETLYNLRAAHECRPQAVSSWIRETDEITRRSVDALKRALAAQTAERTELAHEQVPPPQTSEEPQRQAYDRQPQQPRSQDHHPLGLRKEEVSMPILPAQLAHEQVAEPVMTVRIGPETARVVLTKTPSRPGRLFVRWTDTGVTDEVEASRCQILSFEILGGQP